MEVERLAAITVKFLGVHILILSPEIDEVSTQHDYALQDDALDQKSANQAKPSVIARFALKM